MGKGTLVARLLEADPTLWLSRSWTTRSRRSGEPADAYHFVDEATFDANVARDGFLEWAEFLGHRYGTPRPEATPDRDIVLEIDVQGAAQVQRAFPDALLLLVDAPSRQVQGERLRGRGDPEDAVMRRMAKAEEERRLAAELGARVVINDDLDRAVAEVAAIIDAARQAGR